MDVEGDVELKGDAVVRTASVVDEVSSSDKENNGGGVTKVLKRILSTASDEPDKTTITKTPSARAVLRRSNTFNLSNVSAAEVTNLMDKTVNKKTFVQILTPFIPIILWTLWIIAGTVFYAVYDEFGWAKGFLMSVNVGWSIAWSLPSDPVPSRYYSAISKIVSIVHTAVGALFLGVAVLFMARDLLENNDSWIAMASDKDEMEKNLLKTKTLKEKLITFWRYYISKLRVAKWSVVLIAFGFLWYTFSDDFDDAFGVINFIISSLCAGGFVALDSNSNSLQYSVTAFYTAIGIPLFNVSLGLLLSLVLKKTEDQIIYEKMVAPVTQREQEFMEAFGIDDGDGRLDYKEYVILMAVRMGSVPPSLVMEVQERFHMLDRKHCGEIKYSDLMMPAKIMSRAERIQNFLGSSAKSLSGSFNKLSKSFDSNDPTAERIPIESSAHQQSSSGRVLPLQSPGEGDGNIVIIPPDDIPSTSSKVTPFKDKNSDDDGSEQKNYDTCNLPLRCSDSIEELEVLELPDENRESNTVGDKTEKQKRRRDDVDKKRDDDSTDHDIDCVQSIRSFDRDIDSVDDGAHGTKLGKVSPAEEEEEWEDDGDYFVMKPLLSTSKEVETRIGGPVMPPASKSSPKMSPKTRRPKKQTFRATMSFGSTDGDATKNSLDGQNDKLSLRQKEFLEEIEKLRNAQLKIEMKDTMSSLVYFLRHQLLPHLPAIILWTSWLLGGALFYIFYEDVSISKGLYMSASMGYGIFWIEYDGDFVSNAYTLCHFLLGIGMISTAKALLAQNLLSEDKNWYSDAMKAKELEAALETDGCLDCIIALAEYYWPHVKVYFIFLMYLFLGTIFGLLAFEQWGLLDCLFFSISTMAGGGFVHIPDDAADWCFLFVSFYVVLGVPIMLSAVGILAHQLAIRGSAQLKVEKVNAQVTPEEIEKMTYYGIEDDSGAVDYKEYVILILVRIGAINPEIISVLQDRFDQLDVDKCGEITYEKLRGDGSDVASVNEQPAASSSPV
mmetsp:Transcript_21133/g.39436  ORF Transcript_21133/g.39436 Transcript_21133/m.39436 type:complete len:1004 (-) Transcript_21133:224-3235(-)